MYVYVYVHVVGTRHKMSDLQAFLEAAKAIARDAGAVSQAYIYLRRSLFIVMFFCTDSKS